MISAALALLTSWCPVHRASPDHYSAILLSCPVPLGPLLTHSSLPVGLGGGVGLAGRPPAPGFMAGSPRPQPVWARVAVAKRRFRVGLKGFPRGFGLDRRGQGEAF